MTSLFDPVRFGDIALANRIVMAPLTRNRAGEGRTPTELTVEYYRQRASAGLIVTEASQISPLGQGYLDTPGIYSDAQIAGWKQVTDAVHQAGGKIVIQLWHVGRISHVSLLPEGEVPVAPSAVQAKSKTFIESGFADVSAPRALDAEEIPLIVQQYAAAARNAIAAGFDGVEIHGANGYLIDQFLRDGINRRTDDYGGSIENRARFVLEVTRAVVDAIGAGRTGIRLSPVTPANDAADSNPQSLFNYVAEQLAPLKLAFVHVIEGATGGPRDNLPFDWAAFRARLKTPTIANNGYDRELALDAVAGGRADAVAFGRPFISNPDLPRRLQENAPLNAFDKATFYGGNAKGYTDYPALA